jgi:hypothetical protein
MSERKQEEKSGTSRIHALSLDGGTPLARLLLSDSDTTK